MCIRDRYMGNLKINQEQRKCVRNGLKRECAGTMLLPTTSHQRPSLDSLSLESLQLDSSELRRFERLISALSLHTFWIFLKTCQSFYLLLILQTQKKEEKNETKIQVTSAAERFFVFQSNPQFS
eukprot:TRINITY_DN328_c0_g1_i7.p3 TRINITY_DN328_c0_g1~~TRINITY_DN328_c0_g1_i7.p3  ORF type:complete len:144 (+),score=22.14 TRINITY_DN328_c0_g1_i7:63-434(+)